MTDDHHGVPARKLGYEFDAYDTEASELLELYRQRPAWHADALCREHPEVDFFPPRGSDTREAAAISADCLVQSECLDAALPSDERFGVWGGTGPDDRKKLRRSLGSRQSAPRGSSTAMA